MTCYPLQDAVSQQAVNSSVGFNTRFINNSVVAGAIRNIYANVFSPLSTPYAASSLIISPDSTPITAHYSVTAIFGFGSLYNPIPAGTAIEGQIAVPGAQIGDSVEVTPGDSTPTPGTPIELGIVWCGYVVSAGLVRVRLANITPLPIGLAGRTWRADVTRH